MKPNRMMKKNAYFIPMFSFCVCDFFAVFYVIMTRSFVIAIRANGLNGINVYASLLWKITANKLKRIDFQRRST